MNDSFIFRSQNFHGEIETLERSFNSVLSFCLTLTLNYERKYLLRLVN